MLECDWSGIRIRCPEEGNWGTLCASREVSFFLPRGNYPLTLYDLKKSNLVELFPFEFYK